MSERPRVLLIEDPSLLRIRRILQDFDLGLETIRGHLVGEDLEGTYDLAIATVKQILEFEDVLDLGSIAGKPTWIAVHSQDFLPLRVRLRKMGVSYLVQTSVGSEALRLLVHYSLYQGPNRRDDARLPVGTPVSCVGPDRASHKAVLLDLDRSGCRLACDATFDVGGRITLVLPARLAGGTSLGFPCDVVRCDAGDGTPVLAVSFAELDERMTSQLDDILQGKVIGTVVTRLGDDLSERTASTTIPVGRPRLEREAGAGREAEAPSQREYEYERLNRRVVYEREVTALIGDTMRTILGRDLSIAGVRSEPLPDLHVGDALELAIYGPSGAEPVLVPAVVARDDGAAGTIFHFEVKSPGDRQLLERVIGSAPEVRALDDDSPVVVAQVRKRR